MSTDNAIIRTEFLEGQGLGNQLWVYSVGRALAEHFNRLHVVKGFSKFKGADFLQIDVLEDPSPNEPVAMFNEFLFYDPSLQYFTSIYDSRVEHLPRRVHINGLFQSEAYFYGLGSKLAEWIRPNSSILSLAEQYRGVCVLNLRGGEYKRHRSLILPREYWDHAVNVLHDKIGATDFLVVTDDKEYARRFLPEFPVLEGGVSECYAALMGAKALAVSNSSFSYFPISTRQDRPLVLAPEHWARYGHKTGKWAMPVNVYENWTYLSCSGRLKSYEDCAKAAKKDADCYSEEFYIRIPMTMGVGLSPVRYIPSSIRKLMKRITARFFPTYIG